jgi:hypothetical protein
MLWHCVTAVVELLILIYTLLVAQAAACVLVDKEEYVRKSEVEEEDQIARFIEQKF